MNNILFYTIMNYPIPKKWEYFSTEKENTLPKQDKSFSWETQNQHRETYKDIIIRHQKIFRRLPFIKEVYIGNSLSFNNTKDDSDIDLFIITKKRAIRRARICSLIIFRITGLKRSKKNKKQKYCLSFYITENNQNLYNISLPNVVDIYLAYRVTHLVPIYQEEEKKPTIWKENSRIKNILPNYTEEQSIFLDIPIIYGKSTITQKLENRCSGIRGILIEKIIKIFRLPILLYKTKQNKKNAQRIIISDTMLKFYEDKRQKIHLYYNTQKTKTIKNPL